MKRSKGSPYLLFLPLLLFPLLLVPYSLIKDRFIVDWLGCGCPKLDELGNVIAPDFNANDFTRLFWIAVSLSAAGIAVYLSRLIPKKLIWLRVIYVAAVLTVSLFISQRFCLMMMVK